MTPIRTCIGCRARCPQSELVRLVARDGRLVLDRRHREPGRGAYLHDDRGCVEQAERRRALARALRLPAGAPLDTSTVAELGAKTPPRA